MDGDFIYLTYYQAMAFLIGIDELRKANPEFNDEIAKSYEDYVLKRAGEIVTTYPQVKLKIFPKASKYKITEGLFDYLTNLTSIDVYDKDTLSNCMIKLQEIEAKSYEDFFGEDRKF